MKIEFEPTAFAIDEWWAGEMIMEVEEEDHTNLSIYFICRKFRRNYGSYLD